MKFFTWQLLHFRHNIDLSVPLFLFHFFHILFAIEKTRSVTALVLGKDRAYSKTWNILLYGRSVDWKWANTSNYLISEDFFSSIQLSIFLLLVTNRFTNFVKNILFWNFVISKICTNVAQRFLGTLQKGLSFQYYPIKMLNCVILLGPVI